MGSTNSIKKQWKTFISKWNLRPRGTQYSLCRLILYVHFMFTENKEEQPLQWNNVDLCIPFFKFSVYSLFHSLYQGSQLQKKTCCLGCIYSSTSLFLSHFDFLYIYTVYYLFGLSQIELMFKN